jgi:hypothetical protein
VDPGSAFHFNADLDPDPAFHFNADPDPDLKNNVDLYPNSIPWVRYRTGGRQADESEIKEECRPKEDCRQGELSCRIISGNAGR